MRYWFGGLALVGFVFAASLPVHAEVGKENDPCLTRVPADQLAAAKAEKNPYEGDAAAIAEGKVIFEGKGTCFTCHGMTGLGDGEAGKALDPSPRNFSNPKFWECKTSGEMLWIIRNGSPGTAMIPAVTTGILTDDEAKRVNAYERTFKRK